MPLLLRRSAPSPSIDQLAFSVPAAPLAALGNNNSNNNSSNNNSSNNNLRGSSGSETHFAQLQRCSTHQRMSIATRQSTLSSNNTEIACAIEGCDRTDCSDPQHALTRESSSTGADDDNDASDELQRESGSIRASKKSSQGDQQDDEDTATSEWGYGSEAGRASSAPSCTCSCRDEDTCVTASNVTIEDKQLAVVDMELRDLRKTFADKLYKRLSKMSLSFGRKRLTAS